MQKSLRAPLSFWVFILMFSFALVNTGSAQSPNKQLLDKQMIFFDLKEGKVSKSALPMVNKILDNVVKDFRSKGATIVEIEGHIDASAAEDQSEKLAQTRANAIHNALVAKGLPAAAITTGAAGSSKPLVPVPKGTAEPLNRRVEITLWK